MEEQLLTAEQVAKLLQLRTQTVRDAAWRGKLPCVRLWRGKKKTLLRFRRSEIEAFIREQSVPARGASKRHTAHNPNGR